MKQQGPMSLEQIQAFMSASQEIRFGGRNRKEIYNRVRQTLTEQQYHEQGKVGKGLLRSYLEKMTGLSRGRSWPVRRRYCPHSGEGRGAIAANAVTVMIGVNV